MLLTYFHLRKRLPKKKEWRLEDQFPDDVRIMLDSGGFSANVAGDKHDIEFWIKYWDEYHEFVTKNADRIDIVAEFDGIGVVPGDAIKEEREQTFWPQFKYPDKFMPVWHPTYGLPELTKMAKKYKRIGVNENAVSKPGVRSKINSLTAQYGTKFHGFAITKPEILRTTKFSTVDSTSWLSGMKYGDTIVWDGQKLRRYPFEYKRACRQRHKMLFKKAGFDADLIIKDDANEVTKFTIWSWRQLEAHVARKRGGNEEARKPEHAVEDEDDLALEEDVVDITDEQRTLATAETTTNDVGRTDDEAGTLALLDEPDEVRIQPRTEDEMQRLPILSFREVEGTGEHEGEKEKQLIPKLRSKSLRRCDNCFIATNCPAYKPGFECAYDLPLEIRTKDQLVATMRALIEMQGQRVMFGKMVEDTEGGQINPDLSQEMDRFFTQIKQFKDLLDNRDFLKIEVEARTGAGVLSRIFGAEVGDQAKQLESGGLGKHETDALLGQILDAEVVEDGRPS